MDEATAKSMNQFVILFCCSPRPRFLQLKQPLWRSSRALCCVLHWQRGHVAHLLLVNSYFFGRVLMKGPGGRFAIVDAAKEIKPDGLGMQPPPAAEMLQTLCI